MSQELDTLELVLNTYSACVKLHSDTSADKKIFHLLVDIRRFCEARGLSFYDILLEANTHHVTDKKINKPEGK